MTAVPLAIVGAGPFALSLAALAEQRGISTHVFGEPMGFWRRNMPAGMLLRSGTDWHLDAEGVHTLSAYLARRGIPEDAAAPLPLPLFIDYAEWFRSVAGIEPDPRMVTEVTEVAEGPGGRSGRFSLRLADGSRVAADAVVAAPGLRPFARLPAWAEAVPKGRAAHTCELVDFAPLAGRRVLVVGGRQSAFESAALLADHGAAGVHVVYRHDTPRFAEVSWSFFEEPLARMEERPDWWRRLPAAERDEHIARAWAAGRLTLEPWLVPRLSDPPVRKHPHMHVERVSARPDGSLLVALSDGETLEVDQILYATGYQADLSRVDYLSGLLDRVRIRDGSPVLDPSFGTAVPGLYAVGFCAVQDFGPFFGFVRAAPVTARILVRHLLAT
ncbi:FAD-dependent oxidoreductase [Streptomyces bambusae]|uniref:FAD-dependent oxidoreductase n=1 Tax=Streptomyces bambusae TaxID=1550616 RepID=UPI001CFD251F|nr:FAD-dependent oxidoreductase [Streptomyces bambusae]MCB5167420.1 FAD-dependent oxidoreductase [Streptomyces bambusae]